MDEYDEDLDELICAGTGRGAIRAMKHKKNSDGLLPCPFCKDGGDPQAFSSNTGTATVWTVICTGCHCDGPCGHNLSKEAAIDAWNERNEK